jgi:hypothetical protein
MRKYLVLFLIFFIITFNCYGQDDFTLLAEGKYFSVYGYKELAVEELLSRIDFSYLPYFAVNKDNRSNSLSSKLAKTVDALYLEVSDILDIHVYSFKGKIKIVADKIALNNLFQNFYNREFGERSFYSRSRKTIYISEPDISAYVLGHEMAHAILSSYFVVNTPPKMQEVLAGYVEYELRKK